MHHLHAMFVFIAIERVLIGRDAHTNGKDPIEDDKWTTETRDETGTVLELV